VYPFFILILISILKAFLSCKFFNQPKQNKKIFFTVITASVIGYFTEYFLSYALNGGYTILVWIPWVKLIGKFELQNYLISFPAIFLFTFLIESLVNLIFLKRYFKWNLILKSTFWIDLIMFIILIVGINCILFNNIKGADGIHIMD
jgi:hypothetical protein